MNFTTEQITKAKQAKSAEELMKIAKESGIEMTEEQAKQYFAELHREGELSDEELDVIAGGGKGDPEPKFYVEESLCLCDSPRNHVTVRDRELRNGKWWYYVEFTTLALKGQKTWYAEESLAKM